MKPAPRSRPGLRNTARTCAEGVEVFAVGLALAKRPTRRVHTAPSSGLEIFPILAIGRKLRLMKHLILSTLFLSTVASSALASVADYPVDIYSRPSVLPEGVFEGNLDVSINLSDNTAFKQTVLAPNLRYAVNNDLTVGLSHGRTGSPLSQGSLCLGDACAKGYNNLAFDGAFQLTRGETSVAFLGALEANSLSPELAVGLRFGVDARLKTGDKLMVQLSPQIGLGLTNRDLDTGVFNITVPYNRDYLTFPAVLNFKQNENVNLQVITGIHGALSGASFGDTYRVPAGVGAVYSTGDHTVDLGARFVLPALIAGDLYKLGKMDGINSRELGVFVTFRH